MGKSEEAGNGGMAVKMNINSSAMWLVLISRLSIWLAGSKQLRFSRVHLSFALA